MLAALVPALVLAAAWAPAGGAGSDPARVAAPFVAGLGLLPVAFATRGGRAWLLGFAIVAAACGGVTIAIRLGSPGGEEMTAIGWVLITFATLFGLSSPFLVLGLRGMAATVWLGLAAAGCGSLLLAPGESGRIPDAFLEFNPIVRIFWHALRFDWLHAANLYPRVGTLYYRYPERSEGILIAFALAAAGAAAGGLVALARMRGKARQQ